MIPEMKMFTSLPIYILTSLFVFGCVSALPSAAKRNHDGILQRVLKQDPGNLPIVPEQDPGILENIEETLGEPCPAGWTRFENYCYLVSRSIKSWDQAQKYCESLDAGLVKINSAEENEFVLDLFSQKAPSLKQVWIGLKWSTNKFYWYDNSVPVYKNWAPHEPNGKANEPCGEMWMDGHSHLPFKSAGYWNDVPCHVIPGRQNGIVCERLP